MNTEKMKQVFFQQKQNLPVLRAQNAAQRGQRLLKLKEAALQHADDLAAALYADLGRPPQKPYDPELAEVVRDIDEAVANLETWMAPHSLRASSAGVDIFTMYEPRGSVLLMGAWNFPFSLIFSPLVAIVAAGNSAIVKTNEVAPATSRVIASIIKQAFNENEVAVFEGGIGEAQFLQSLNFDHVFFTGSPKVGKTVMQAAAAHLSSVTLELGGKSPGIVDKSADFNSAIKHIGMGKSYNCGQVCLSVDHLWLPKHLFHDYVEGVKAWFSRAYYANGQFSSQRLGRIVNEANFRRVKNYLDDALQRGAEVAFGGNSNLETLTMEPTMLLNVPLDALIMREEIFAPILPVLAYNDLQEVITFINNGEKPLAIYLYAQDQAVVERVLNSTSCGGVNVNSWAAHFSESKLPFGGVNNSGIGRYHGVYGFRELSHEKAV